MLEFQHHAKTATLDIAYADSGPADGPIVLLIHGWPDAARAWNAVAARLNEAGYRTIVPELRGAGGTRFLRDDTVRDGSGVALANDAVDLADALGIAQFDVVGHDWGARAAYTISALFPDRVRRMAALALAFSRAASSNCRISRRRGASGINGSCRSMAARMPSPPIPKASRASSGKRGRRPAGSTKPNSPRPRAPSKSRRVPITLNALPRRWREDDQPSDPALAELYARLATIERIDTPR